MKLDLVKTYKTYYKAGPAPQLAEFEKVKYIAIQGKGEPAGKEYVQKLEALYPVAYGIKKNCKAKGKDFGVPKLEAFWWVEGMKDGRQVPRSEWCWKLLIRMPDFATKEMLKAAQAEVVKKKKSDLANTIEWFEKPKGRFAHVMHVGPYTEEAPTIDSLHSFIETKGLKIEGLHHEIYLSDPRKVKPKDLKTLIRYEVA